jgi:hypothetical protein
MRGDKKLNLEPVRIILDAERLLAGVKMAGETLDGIIDRIIERRVHVRKWSLLDVSNLVGSEQQ